MPITPRRKARLLSEHEYRCTGLLLARADQIIEVAQTCRDRLFSTDTGGFFRWCKRLTCSELIKGNRHGSKNVFAKNVISILHMIKARN
jgi:hypothetical protein